MTTRTEDGKRRGGRSVSHPAWLRDRLGEAFLVGTQEESGFPEKKSAGDLKRRKVLDLFIAPGRIVGKVQEEGGGLKRIELELTQLSDAEWGQVTTVLAESAYLLGRVLSGVFPPELDSRTSERNIVFVPIHSEALSIMINGEKGFERTHDAVAALMDRVIDRIHNDPFLLFVLRGRGREEILFEVGELRRRLAESSIPQLPAEDLVLTTGSGAFGRRMNEDVWKLNKELFELSYNLRADELPGLILKRLDPLPLSGLEDDVEPLLEDAYVRVARRAQAFGFGMK